MTNLSIEQMYSDIEIAEAEDQAYIEHMETGAYYEGEMSDEKPLQWCIRLYGVRVVDILPKT